MAVQLRVLALAFALTTIPIMGALAHTPHDDAGTHRDAPDDPDRALALAPGAYVGNLTPGAAPGHHDDYNTYENDSVEDDADWYRTNSSEDATLACTSASYSPDEKPHNETRVHIREPQLDHARLNTTTNDTTTLAHVGPSASGTLLGLSHLDPPRVTEYELDVNVTTLAEVGAADTAAEVPGPCFGGNLEDGEVQEWTFEAEEGEFLYASIGTELDRMDDLVLEAPNGSEIGSITSGEDVAIGAHTFEETGTYTLSAQGGDSGFLTTTSSNFIVGFNVIEINDPEEEEEEPPCSPNCMAS